MKPDNANLDLLRSIAVLCVVVAHFVHFLSGRTPEWAWHVGQIGVLMFFVHTSLVLMMSMDRTKAPQREAILGFWVRRLFRIYPLSVVCVLIVYFTGVVPQVELFSQRFPFTVLAANISLTQNILYLPDMIGVLWSLPLEVQMYILLPLLYVGLKGRSVKTCIAVWLVSVLIALVQMRWAGRLNVLTHAPCFVPGVMAWRLMGTRKPRLASCLWPSSIVALAPLWLVATRAHHMYFRWVFCFALGLTLPLFLEMTTIWVVKTAKLIAKYSFGIYLSHQWTLMISFILLKDAAPPIKWAVCLALLCGLPVLMYHTIEHPFIMLGQRLVSRWDATRLTTVSERARAQEAGR